MLYKIALFYEKIDNHKLAEVVKRFSVTISFTKNLGNKYYHSMDNQIFCLKHQKFYIYSIALLCYFI